MKGLEKIAQCHYTSGSKPNKPCRALAWNTQTVPLPFPVRLEIIMINFVFVLPDMQ
jgi:hypothetical protein